jgi:hypothetical protein
MNDDLSFCKGTVFYDAGLFSLGYDVKKSSEIASYVDAAQLDQALAKITGGANATETNKCNCSKDCECQNGGGAAVAKRAQTSLLSRQSAIQLNANANTTTMTEAEKIQIRVRAMEQRAATMFFYHLGAMGMDAWDYEKQTNPCVENVRRLACYTYFPRCQQNAKHTNTTSYLRPCSSSCENMIRECGVECCDESVTCSFTHTKTVGGNTYETKGYVDRDGPSKFCTGGASRHGVSLIISLLSLFFLDGILSVFGKLRSSKVALLLLLGTVAISASGCKSESMDVPTHSVGNWRKKSDYLLSQAYLPPNAPAGSPGIINSCRMSTLSASVQCSGRGACETFEFWKANEKNNDKDSNDDDDKNTVRDMSIQTAGQRKAALEKNAFVFCKCERDWAGPECQEKRKSQLTAYFLSIFFGLFGADHFYLGFPVFGALKLVSLGGLGIWWLADVIRIGSSAPMSKYYRCSKDLPHWAFVLTCISFAFIVGFIVMVVTTVGHVRRRRKDALLRQAEDEDISKSEFPYSTAFKTPTAQPYANASNPTPQYQFPVSGSA